MTTDQTLASFTAARPFVRAWLEAMMTERQTVERHGYDLLRRLEQQPGAIEITERVLISLETMNVIERTKQDFAFHPGIKTLGSFGSAGDAFSKRTTLICYWFQPALPFGVIAVKKMIERLKQ